MARASAGPRTPTTYANAISWLPTTRASVIPRPSTAQTSAVPRPPMTCASVIPRPPAVHANSVSQPPMTYTSVVPRPPTVQANAVSLPPMTHTSVALQSPMTYANAVSQPPQPECVPLVYLDMELIHKAGAVEVRVLIDCGGQSNFVDKKLFLAHSFSLFPRLPPVSLKLANGLSARTSITDYIFVKLHIAGYDEPISLDITLCTNDIILGILWLHKHNSTIDWHTDTLTFSSSYCRDYCKHYGQT
jgi:hypothetical protein